LKKEFLLNIILLLGINFLVKPFYLFGVDLHIQNLVGEESYGMYKVLFNIAFLLQFIHEPGIQSYNSQNIAKNPDQLKIHLPRILGLKSILGIVYFVLALGYFFYRGYDPLLLNLMVFTTINIFLSSVFVYLRTNIAAIGKYRIDSMISSLDKILMLIILGYLSYTSPYKDNFQIIWLAYGQFFAFVISCIVALVILYKHLGTLSITFSSKYSKDLLKASLPFALVLLTMSAYTRMDSIMLEHLLDDNGFESGVYEYGYRFLDAMNMIGYLFAALLIPMFASNLKNKKVINDLVDTGLRTMTVITFVGASTLITFRKEIMEWSKAGGVDYDGDIILYLMLSFIMISMAYIFGSLLVANKNLKRLNILFIIGVLINFILNYWQIPLDKALGAAKSTFITQTIMTLGQAYLAISLLKIKIGKRILVNMAIFGLFCALLSWVVSVYSPIEWWYNIILYICVTLFFAFISGLMDIKLFISLLKKEKAEI